MNSSLRNMMLSLGGISLVVGALLAVVHLVTEEPIAQSRRMAKIEALSKILPKFSNNPLEEASQVAIPDETRPLTIYPAEDEAGNVVGVAVESYTLDGFSGEIEVMAGFDTTGTLLGYEILRHAETPGLGAKAPEWFSDATGHRSVIGSTGELSVTKDGGTIDAITAATITSRAFLQAINRARKALMIFMDTNSHS